MGRALGAYILYSLSGLVLSKLNGMLISLLLRRRQTIGAGVWTDSHVLCQLQEMTKSKVEALGVHFDALALSANPTINFISLNTACRLDRQSLKLPFLEQKRKMPFLQLG